MTQDFEALDRDEEIPSEDVREDLDKDLLWEEEDPADRRKDPLRT